MTGDNPDLLTRYHALRARLLALVMAGGYGSEEYRRVDAEASSLWDTLDSGQQADAEGSLLVGAELTGGVVSDDEAAKWKAVD